MNEKQDTRLDEMARQLQERFLAYTSGQRRLLIQIVRELAHGRPITSEQVDQWIAALGLEHDAAHQFLGELTERDANDRIVGAIGLSLEDHPHRLTVEGVSLSAWCALDTLFLPALLQRTATIASPSPMTGQSIRLRVSPERIEEVQPVGAVISIVLVDPSQESMASVEAIWNAFCSHIHLFTSREEGERWAAGRDDITILSVEEGFALGVQVGVAILTGAA